MDTFKNSPDSQSGIIWKSQVMRADPLDVTLGICVRLLYPVRVPPPPSGWCVCLRGVLFVVFGFWPWFGVCCCGFNLVRAPAHMSRRPCNSMLMRRHVSESLLKHTHTSTSAHAYVAQLARFCMHFLDPARRIICSACSQALRYGIHSF